MAEKSVNIRLSLKDGEVVKRALLSLGADGEKALQRITNAAPHVSRGLKVVNAAVVEARTGISLWAAEAGAGGRVLAAFGPAGLAAAAGIGVTVLGLKSLIDGAKRAVDAFDNLSDSADRLGVGVESLQALRFAASQLGVDAGVVDGALQKLGVTLGDLARGENKAAQEAFNQLGVSAKDARGNIKSIEQVLPELANGFARIRSETTQLSLGTDIFGRGNVGVVSLLRGGAANLDEQIRKARELGAVIDEALVRRGAAAKDQLDGLAFVIQSQFNAALVDMAPLLVKVSEAFAQLARAVGYYTDMSRPLDERQTQSITDKLAGLRKELEAQQRIMEEARANTNNSPGVGSNAWMLGTDFEQLFFDAQKRVVELRLEINKLQNELDRRQTVNISAKRDFGSFPAVKGEGSGLAIDPEDQKRIDDAVKGFMSRMDEARRVVDATRTAARQYADELQRLNELKKQGIIGETEYAKAVLNAKIELQEATKAERDRLLAFRTDSGAGIERALNQLRDKALDDASAVEDAYTGMADTISGAFEDFAATGKLNLESLAEDFRRILAKMAVHYLQSAIFRMLFPTGAAPGLLAPIAAIAPSIVGGPGAGLSSAFVPALAKAITPAAYTSGALGPTAAGLIKNFEGYRSNAYWDVNAYRVGYGSDTMTSPAGDVSRVMAGSTTTAADAMRDLTRRVAEFQDVIRGQIGPDAFSRLGQNSKASLTSVAYNYGSLPDSVAAAARSGDPTQIANAIRGLSSNPDRRIAEANNALLDNAQQMTKSSAVMTENLTAIADGTQKAGREFGNKFPSGLQSIMQAIGGGGSGMTNFFGTPFNLSFGNLLGPMGRPHGYYAKGDVFSRPHIFPMAQGWGLMAEAGPEGVLPLRRNRRGDLGVILAGIGNDNGRTGVVIHSTVVNNLGVEGTAETRQSQNADGSYSVQTILDRKIDGRINRQVPAINQVGYGMQPRLKLR